VVRAPASFVVPDSGHIVSLQDLLLMGEGLAKGEDVFSNDPRAFPGSFLQVCVFVCLLFVRK
jgi:hypothetical protein